MKRVMRAAAVSIDVAISSLQRRGLLVSSIKPEGQAGSIFDKDFRIFEKVTPRDVVILSRQMATLFGAQVSALRVFRLLAAETENAMLSKALFDIADDLQAGSAISKALAFTMIGGLRIYRPIHARQVAAGLIAAVAADGAGMEKLEYDALVRLAAQTPS